MRGPGGRLPLTLLRLGKGETRADPAVPGGGVAARLLLQGRLGDWAMDPRPGRRACCLLVRTCCLLPRLQEVRTAASGRR